MCEAAVASIASVSLCFLPPTDYIVLTITLRPETTLSSSLVASADTYLYSLTNFISGAPVKIFNVSSSELKVSFLVHFGAFSTTVYFS